MRTCFRGAGWIVGIRRLRALGAAPDWKGNSEAGITGSTSGPKYGPPLSGEAFKLSEIPRKQSPRGASVY